MPEPHPPFVLSPILELAVLRVVGESSGAAELLIAESEGLECTTVIVLVPTGEVARDAMGPFDLLWIDRSATQNLEAPWLVPLMAAASASHLPMYTPKPLAQDYVDLPVGHQETLADAIRAVRDTTEPRTPRGGLDRLKRHYARMAAIRGYGMSRPQDTLLLLTEEMGELAHALRNYVGLERAHLQRNLNVIRTRSGDRYKPSALRAYEQGLRSKLLPALGPLKLSALTRNAVQDLVDRLVAEGASASTVRNAVLPQRAIYRRAVCT